jgi:hypothetical protein
VGEHRLGVGESGDLRRHDVALFHGGARAAHALGGGLRHNLGIGGQMG